MHVLGSRSAKFWLLTTFLFALLAACAGAPPKPDKAKAIVSAGADVNPDSTGRPSPVVVRIYQLKEDVAFRNADFFALYDKEAQTLGADLLAREEFVLAPGDSRKVEFAVQHDTRFIGVAAAFRDIRNARWRAIAAAPKKGLTDVIGKDAITIEVAGDEVSLSVKD
jgi:type VI secretion system protein VasD